MIRGLKLKEEILKDIFEVLGNSAYHLKVVDGPIAALVCTEENFVKDVIAKINTAERQSRAYRGLRWRMCGRRM